MVEGDTIPSEEVSLPMDSLAMKATLLDSSSFWRSLQSLEFVPISRERVVPTEWQVRSVVGDCISKAKVISTQAPQYRQFALISDFLDLANLSIRKEAALATNWIKDRLEGLKLFAGEELKPFQSVTARFNFLAMDRQIFCTQ